MGQHCSLLEDQQPIETVRTSPSDKERGLLPEEAATASVIYTEKRSKRRYIKAKK
jgi:hypothetical protein